MRYKARARQARCQASLIGRPKAHVRARLPVMIVIICLGALSGRAVQISDEDGKTLETIITAVKSISNPRTGVGSARVVETWSGYEELTFPESRETIVDFKFTPELTRSDIYLRDEHGRGRLDAKWVQGHDKSVVLREHSVGLTAKPPAQFRRKLGKDYHPDVFVDAYPGRRLWEHLEVLRTRTPAKVKVRIDDNNIVHIVTHYQEGQQFQSIDISLDPSIGYRVIAYVEKRENMSPRHPVFFRRYDAKWDKHDGELFVQSAMFEEGGTRIEDGEEHEFRHRTELGVTEFRPNVALDEADFTFVGLDPPAGIIVVDRILGVDYAYGVQPTVERDLREALKKAEAQASAPGPEHEPEPIRNDRPTTRLAAAPNGARDPQDRDRSSDNSLAIIIGLCAVGAIGIALLVLRRARHARRERGEGGGSDQV